MWLGFAVPLSASLRPVGSIVQQFGKTQTHVSFDQNKVLAPVEVPID